MSFERFDQLIPAAYNNLIKQTVESNRWVIYKTIAEGFRDFILDAGVLDIKDADAVKMFVKVEEDRVEAVRHAVLQATGTIDLADRKWQTNDAQLPQAW
jgi:tRNA(Ile2) C34 agmatinyltransferase TiaS